MAKKKIGRHPVGKVESSPRTKTPPARKRGAPAPQNPAASAAELASSPAVRRAGAEERIANGSFPVVGIGASAGGLEAFTELLGNLPNDTGMAFVLIQHLDPKHDSHLSELLSKASKMPVAEVQGDTRVEANHVYVISPRHNLDIAGGVLHARPRLEGGRNMPVDAFLRSLAADRGGRAYGVILSGTASDGTLGIQAIKARHGVTFAQELRSARFDGMPRSAIATGAVDLVLPPAGIAKQLVTMARRSSATLEAQKAIEPSDEAELELHKIFRLLRSAAGVDFTHYKRNTIKRRIRRRMTLRGFKRLEDYIGDLEQHPEEANALCQDLFITVTAFFREPSVFQQLRKKVFPALVGNRGIQDPIRIWVPGCATGQEAYSIAMSLTEFLDDAPVRVPFQIFATDINEAAIEKARAGIYPESALASVSPKRLARFFAKSARGFQVVKTIREACTFATQNVAQDPPFSKLDLISCCNVLIYLGPALQRKVLSMFHYALKPAGFLMLGPSESTSAFSQLFHHVDGKYKIYTRLAAIGKPALERAKAGPKEARVAPRGWIAAGVRIGPDVQREADRLALAEYRSAGVIVNEAMNILQVRGRTGPYLELSPGEPTHNILKMAREGLMGGLSKAIRTAAQTNAVAQEEGVRVESTGLFREVRLKVIPFRGSSSSQERYFLVLFEDAETGESQSGTMKSAAIKGAAAKPKAAAHANGESGRLRLELASAKEYLQSIIEDKETTLEELQSANEEVQAANEELETAKEELESANEELSTLNEELRTTNVELGQVNRDLTNLLESISIPLVMVGRDLRIHRFTRAMEPMLNLIASDAGRSITDLQPQMDLPDLRQLLLDAMEGGGRKPRDIRDSTGRWYSLRILPSLGPDGSIDGAVVMLIDVDAAKRGRDFAEAIVETVREPLVTLDQNMRIIRANKAFYDTFHVAREETEQRLIYELGDGQWNIPKLRELLDDILPLHSAFHDFEVAHTFENVGRKVMLLNAREVFDPNAQARAILLAIEDTTERKRAEEALQATNIELEYFAYALTHDLQEPLRMVVNFTQLLAEEHAGKLGDEADKFISYAVDGAVRIEALVKGLLAYWEITERGSKSLVPLDCNEVLAKALLNLQSAIAESGAIVTSDPLPTVPAEELMLMELFQNLIANSIKYRGGETPKIHLAAERNANAWLFSVRDNGIGIDPQHAQRVFGIFKRLHGKEIPGTGIGLALCKKIVERHGGDIWVESEPGQGATFKFAIPVYGTSRAGGVTL